VRLLLDTHALLWWLADDPRLSRGAREAIVDPDALVHVSAVSVWECAIKATLGKLDLGGADLVDEIPANGFLELPVSARDAWDAGALPRHHDDPFDRMLVAQARREELVLVTRDAAFVAYGVSTLTA
jgi:PIN domain nuclease of toxin-antitoxin system